MVVSALQNAWLYRHLLETHFLSVIAHSRPATQSPMTHYCSSLPVPIPSGKPACRDPCREEASAAFTTVKYGAAAPMPGDHTLVGKNIV